MLITSFARHPSPSYFRDAFAARKEIPALTSPTLIAFSDTVTGLYTEITGAGLNLTSGSGTVSGFSTWTAPAGDPVWTVTGIAWDLGDFLVAVDAHLGGDDAPLAALFALQPVSFDATDAVAGVRFAPLLTAAALAITGSAFDDTLTGGTGHDTIRGGGGHDTLSGFGGADEIRGGVGRDTLLGGGGADTLMGGAGADTADFTGAQNPVTANLATGTATGQGTDTLESIENLAGSSHGDALLGDGGANRIGGGAGSDTLNGRGGDDRLYGDSGDDLIEGGAGNDTLNGGDGFDSLKGNGGDDTLNGGDGYDMVFYADAVRGVTVALGPGRASGQGRDTLRGIEDVTGSGFGDLIAGDDGDNIVNGLNGDDTLTGQGNHDTLNGGDGADVIAGGTGRDVLSGDRGTDRLAGGGWSDVLSGGGGRDTLTGGRGHDTITGGDAADRFVFRGHIDADTLTDYRKGTDTLALDPGLWGGGLSAAQVVTTYATDTGPDVLFDFGGGETILLEGVASRAGLYLDIDIL